MKRIKILIVIILCCACAATGFLAAESFQKKRFKEQVDDWLQSSRTDEAFISQIPIYEDYADNQKELLLRRHLFGDHYEAVLKAGRQPVKNSDDVRLLADKDLLVPIEDGENSLFFFYGVKKENRFLAPQALKALELTADRFNEKLSEKGLPTVKLALSSALRTDEYQQKLRKKNSNAVPTSTHSYGMSFDIFYDDYYVKLPTDGSREDELMKRRIGFMLGDSLRRQLRTVLFQTLTELQEEGRIYAIWEKRQRCYHVTPAE